jgi:hypothetical protein
MCKNSVLSHVSLYAQVVDVKDGNAPLLMYRQSSPRLEDTEIPLAEFSTGKRIIRPILYGVGLRCRRLMPRQAGKCIVRRLLAAAVAIRVPSIIVIHMRQVRVRLWVHVCSVRLLSLCATSIVSIWSPIGHSVEEWLVEE